MLSLSEIIFPSRCIGCSRLGISICSHCRKDWHPHFYQRSINSDGEIIPVISAIQYSPLASKILLSAKEAQIKSADLLIISALMHSLKIFVNKFGSGTLVYIPSRKSATRKRGRNFLAEITSQLAAELGLSVATPLSHLRKVKDQSQLNSSQRAENLYRAFSADSSAGNIGEKIIVIDDLITTGATLQEAFRALRDAGFTVLGAVTSCTAKPLR